MAGRIIIADDHPLMRSAIRGAVEKLWHDTEIIEVPDASAARQEAIAGDVELLTLDLHMDDSNGLQALMAFRQDYPEIPVAIISASEETRIHRGARDLGAAAFIPKSASLHVMRDALAAVQAGDSWFPDNIDEAEQQDDSMARLASLTPSQRRILILVAQGKLNKQIAYEMDISEATVKAHMTAVFRRLGVVNRTQAVLFAKKMDVALAPSSDDSVV